MIKKRERLIPVEESRRIIRLEKRGKRRQHMPFGSVLLIGLGILFLIYCLSTGILGSGGTRFFLIWGAAGAGLILLGLLSANESFRRWLPDWLKIAVGIAVGVATLIFVIVESLIFTGFSANAPQGADVLIVLGAQWKENGPSIVLRMRLDKAVEYLQANPDTKVIVSGGQGANEPISEAAGMSGYLEEKGIAPERILQEPDSANTYENLANSAALLNREQDTVVIVTNNFHIYRAVKTARKIGYENVSGLAAPSSLGMLPNNMLREFLAVLKNLFVGNMALG